MMISGFMGLLQAAFFPGLSLVAVLFLGEEDIHFTEVFIYSFGLSLALNYIVTLFLTCLSTNMLFPHETLFFLAAFVLFWVFFKNKGWFGRKIAPPLLLILSVTLLNLLLCLFVLKGSSIFRGADEIFSWNRWALQWSHDQIPDNVRHYPQLLPIAFSVIHLFTGNLGIDFFPKALMPDFTLVLLMVFFAFYGRKRDMGYLLAVPFFVFLLYAMGWGGQLALMGLADVPSACTLFLSYYAFCRWKSDPQNRIFVVLCAVFTGAACVTKQGGLILLVFFLAAMFLEKNRSILPQKSNKLDWALFWAVVLLFALPWYGYAEYAISAGKNNYDAAETWVLHRGVTWFQAGESTFTKFFKALELLSSACHGVLVTGLIVGLCVYSLALKGHRLILALMVFVYVILWSLFLSYDTRNLLPATPFFALGAGLALGNLLARFKMFSEKAKDAHSVLERLEGRRRPILISVFILLVVVLGVLARLFPKEKLESRLSAVKMEKLGDSPELNKALYGYFGQQTQSGQSKIASSYIFLSVMPQLSERYLKVDLTDPKGLDAALKDSSVSYVLVVFANHWRNSISDSNLNLVKQGVQKGSLKPIFQIPDGWLLQIKGRKA